MAGVTIREWYERVNSAWMGPVPTLTEDEARIAAKRLWRWATTNRLPYSIAFTQGRRYTWERRGVLFINAEKGWGDFVHMLSHLIWRRENAGAVRPHEKQHAKFELAMRREVQRRGWLDGELKREEAEPEAPPSKDDERHSRHEKVCAAIVRWEKKLAKAQRALTKLHRREAGLRRHLMSVR